MSGALNDPKGENSSLSPSQQEDPDMKYPCGREDRIVVRGAKILRHRRGEEIFVLPKFPAIASRTRTTRCPLLSPKIPSDGP